MSVEFRVTSDFRELAQIAEQRNASPEWRGVLEIKPSVNRVEIPFDDLISSLQQDGF